jgi:lipopolysaccharide biosynthesis glycosyltransferase
LSLSARAESIQVVCAVEGEDYVRHCAVMLHSLLLHNQGAGVHIHYLHGGEAPEGGRTLLAEMVTRMEGSIEFHRVADSWVEGLPTKDFTRKATWYRIALDELLPGLDRVLYLDVDLVVKDSLRPLWETSLQGQLIGAVTNIAPIPFRPYTERPELGGDPYFNAGVLLMDLASIRLAGIGPELRAHARRHADRLKWRDQDALNEVLHGRRLPLHPRWNCMNSVMHFHTAVDYFSAQEITEARRSPAIRHFEGPSDNKPWHLLSDPEHRAQYMEHRIHTPWPRLRSSGRTPVNLVRYAARRVHRIAE